MRLMIDLFGDTVCAQLLFKKPGVRCEIDIDECQSNPCNNHGTCHDHVASYSCTCETGWTSTGCDVNIDECASNPCFHGTCLDGIDAYR